MVVLLLLLRTTNSTTRSTFYYLQQQQQQQQQQLLLLLPYYYQYSPSTCGTYEQGLAGTADTWLSCRARTAEGAAPFRCCALPGFTHTSSTAVRRLGTDPYLSNHYYNYRPLPLRLLLLLLLLTDPYLSDDDYYYYCYRCSSSLLILT